MTISVSEIPTLRLTVLNKLVTKFLTPPTLRLMSMFGSTEYESDNIEWESQIGSGWWCRCPEVDC